MFNYIKTKGKHLLFLSVIFAIASVYITIVLKRLMMGMGVSVNPIILIGFVKENGFPLRGSVVVFIVLVGLVVYSIWKNKTDGFEKDERNFKYSNSGVYGTAKMLQADELNGYAKIDIPKKAMGTILGQLDKTGTKLINTDLKSRINKHVAVFGCSGSGKSRSYARPFMIQCVKRRESVIVTDPKGELYESTAQYMKENGYIVKILDLVHPELSDGWACLKELKGDDLTAQIFSNIVIENTGSGKGDIWDKAAMSLLKALILRVDKGHDFKERNAQNIGEAYRLIQNPMGEKHLDTMFDSLSLTPEEQACIGPYMSFKQASDNMRGNIITGLANQLQVFQNDVICRMTEQDDIDLVLPATQPCAYYCIMSDQHTTLNFISTLFFAFLFKDLVEYADLNGGRCLVPVNFLLDEFPNIGTIPDFDKKIATVRSRDINISIIFQDINQLGNRYPHTWQSIISNCDTHVVLGVNDPVTANFISERSGETTVKVKTEQHGKVESWFQIGRKHSTGDGKRKIFTPDEILRMPLDRNIVIFRGKDVLSAFKFDFSLHPESKKFKMIRMADRPPIYDKAARLECELTDKQIRDSYYAKKGIEYKKDTKSDLDTKHSIFKKHKIKQGADIELQEDNYSEFEEASVVDDIDIEVEDAEVFDIETNDNDIPNKSSTTNPFEDRGYKTDKKILEEMNYPSMKDVENSTSAPPTGKKFKNTINDRRKY